MNFHLASPTTDDSPEEGDRQQRFILAALDRYTYVFPSNKIMEIVLVDRGKILTLPHYHPAFLGVIEHKSQIIPLVSMRHVVGIPIDSIGETLTVVRLSYGYEGLGGAGLVFDKTLGSCLTKELPSDLLGELNDKTSNSTANNDRSDYRLFRSNSIEPRLWQPSRWL